MYGKYLETFGGETIQGMMFEIFLSESHIELNGIMIRIYNTLADRGIQGWSGKTKTPQRASIWRTVASTGSTRPMTSWTPI